MGKAMAKEGKVRRVECSLPGSSIARWRAKIWDSRPERTIEPRKCFTMSESIDSCTIGKSGSNPTTDGVGMAIRGPNESKPIVLKLLVINEINQKWADQTHRKYLLTDQWFGVAWRPDSLEKQTDGGRLRPTLICWQAAKQVATPCFICCGLRRTSTSPRRQKDIFMSSPVSPLCLAASVVRQAVDSLLVGRQVARPRKPRHAESKGLISGLKSQASEGWTTFRGSGWWPKCVEANLLIPQRLMASLLRRTDEGLLNLKGLLSESVVSCGTQALAGA